MNTSLRPILLAATAATLLAACGQSKPGAAADAAQQQLVAATTQAKQAESDRERLDALRIDGSVSTSDDEYVPSGLHLPRWRRLPRPERGRLAVRLDSNASNTQLLPDSIQLSNALGRGWQIFEPNKESSS